MSKDYLFTNFRYNPEIYYFFYIGELKSIGLSDFLPRVLAAGSDRKVECVAIIPDLLEHYCRSNLIVPHLHAAAQPPSVSFRRNTDNFFKEVSADPAICALIDMILEYQEQLYIFMFESSPSMTLDRRDRVHLLGPDTTLARKLNNKAVQFEMLSAMIPSVEYIICDTYARLLKVAEQLRPTWCDGIFVSRVYSAAGSGSIITRCREDVESFFTREDAPFLLTRFMNHEYDPTVLAVVANEEDVYIAGVADQCIEGGNHFVGSTWPSVLAPDLLHELHEYTRIIGREIGRRGYRGIFGCDYIITEKNQVLFIEINARKQGTTLEFCYALEQTLPVGSPSLPELEYFAVQENRFPEKTLEPAVQPEPGLCWGTYNYKVTTCCHTSSGLAHNEHEHDCFSQVHSGVLTKEYLILDHVGSGREVLPGTFLARIVAVGQDSQCVQEGLASGRTKIAKTVDTQFTDYPHAVRTSLKSTGLQQERYK